MKQLLLKQLTTKRLILLVLSFIMLMPSTAWGEEYTYDSDSFFGWDGNGGTYSCLTIDFQNSTTVYSPDQFSNISKVEIVAGGASQIYSSFAVSVNGSDYQSIVSTTGNGYVIPSNVDYDTYTFEFTPEETPQYIKISAQYDAMSGTQGWVYIQSVTVYYTEEKKTTEFYAALSDDGKTVTFYYDDQKKSRGGQNIFSTLDRFYAEATTAVIDKSMAKYAPADMTTWFLNCSALTSITGLDNLNTTEVRNMQSLFQGCSSLTSLDLTCFDTSNLINMNGMFAYCSSLKSVDLSSFNTSKVTDMGGLFAYCSDLETIYVDETRWSTAAVTSENNGNSGLFYECGPLVGGNGTAYYDTYDTDGEDLEYARVDKPGQPGYLTHKSAVENDPEPYAVLSNENTVLTFYYDGKKKNRHGLSVGPFTVDYPLSGNQSWADASSSITSVVFDASFANCTSITSTVGWFYDLCNLQTITGIENLKTDNVTDMSYMFYRCLNLTSLDVSGFNTANVTNMLYMFTCCSSLTSLDLSHFNTANVTNMAGMFDSCKGLLSLDLSHFNTEKVTDMGTMFEICSSLTSLDLSSFNTTNVESMTYMFDQCSSLTSLDLSSFNTTKVEYMPYMFANCDNLINLDISSFNTANVKNMRYMFYACHNLTTIYAGQDWSTAKVTSGNNMFQGCDNLIGGAGTTYNSSHYDYTYARIDEGTSKPGYFTDVNAKPAEGDPEPYAVLSNDNTVLIFYYDNQKETRGGYTITHFVEAQKVPWYKYRYNIKKVVFNPSMAYCTTLTSTAFWFSDQQKLATIEGLNYLRLDNVTDMKCMFFNCPAITSVDLSNKNAKKVENMCSMFWSCEALETINLNGFVTEELTDVSLLFFKCRKISSLDLTGFKTDHLVNMEYMFNSCNSLTTLDISHFNTANVTSMGHMFFGCSKLTSLDVSNFNTTNVTYMEDMFEYCSSLTSLDVSNFDTSNVMYMSCMFNGCSGLTSIDVSNFNSAKVMSMSAMFSDCTGLTSLDLSNFNSAKVTSMNAMFSGCSGLTTIYVGNGWTTTGVTEGDNTFKGCTSLVGGNGTIYSTSHTDYTYARIDGGAGNPGYFTKKDGSAMESCDMSEIPTDNAYYAATSFLCERGVLDGSKVGGKYLVEDPLLRKHLANISFRGLFTLKGREIPGTFVSDQYPDVYDDLKSDSSYYQAAKVLLYLDYGDGITPFDRDRDGFFPDGNEARINILKELMEAFNIKSDTVGTDNPFPKDADIKSLSESSPIKMGYVRQAAKLGIITTENEQFRPYDDCLRGEAFLMLTRIIQKIEAGEIADPNPKESDFLDPNSGTGTAEPYAVLSDDNTVLTFYYDNKKESRGGIDINNSYIWNGSSSPYGTATTAAFDASFANYKPTSTAYWFHRCSLLTSITGMENLKTGNVTSMEDMFSDCSSLTSLDLSNFNTASVTSMSSMFYGCSGLTSLGVSGFNTASVTSMSSMFYGCSGLTSLDVSGFNTANVTDMGFMFSGCSGLTSLDVSGFNTVNVTDMGSMFSGCSGLITIYVGSGWTTTSLTTGAWMFEGCTNLVGGAGTVVVETNNFKYTGESYAHIDGGADNPGYFTEKSATPVEGDAEPYAVLSNDNTVLTFYYDSKKESRGGLSVGPFSKSDTRWGDNSSMITSVVFDASFSNCTSITSTAYWFCGFKKLQAITGIENLKTDNVTDMRDMFNNCCRMESFDLGKFDTRNVTDMTNMFIGCQRLKSLDLSKFDTHNVTSMESMFLGCIGLKSLDVSNFDTKNVTSMREMFAGCEILTSLDLSHFDTDKVTSFVRMFLSCYKLTTIYCDKSWEKDNVDSQVMFYNCTSLPGYDVSRDEDDNPLQYAKPIADGGYFTPTSEMETPDTDSEPYAVLSNNNTVLTFYYDSKKESRGGLSVGPFKDEKDRAWNTYRESISSVVFDESFAKCTTLTSTAYWFYECSSLTGITGISNLKTDHVTDMKFMFHGCESLTSIDVSGFKTDNVENIQGMFFRCEQLTSMDLSGFNTEKVTNMSALFSRCVGMISVDLSGFKTDLVTSMRLMFNQCSSLTSLNLTDFNTGKVTDMGYMFADCSSLKTIDVSKTGWDFSQLLDGTNMFKNCTNLKGGAGTAYDGNHTDYTYAHIDGGAANPGYFTEKNATPVEDGLEPYAVFDSGTLTFYYDKEKVSRGGMSVGPFALDDERWDGYSANITTVVFDPSFAKCTSLTSTAYWFFECYNLTTIKGIENLKTGNVTDMSAMFYQCSSLTSLDLANWDTRNVTNMMCMFMYCSELTSLNLMGFNTAKVTDMDCMFRSCRKLGSLLLNDFDTGNVTNMWCMFFDCPNLIALDVSSFNTSKVTNISSMFQSCSKLTVIDVRSFNTSSVTNMDQMFSDCPSLKTIDVSSFDTKNVTDFRCMFYGCSELSTIYCNDTWNSEAESSQMFDGCEKLVGGNGTTYDADHKDGTYARVDGGADAPGYFTANGVVDENIEYKYGEGTGLVVHAAKDDTMELYIKGTVIIDDVACPVTAIGESAFENNTVLEEVSIPATITSFGEKAFAGCINLKAIYVYIRIPVDITSSKARTRGDGVSTVFEGVDTETCTLYVPAGSGDSYRNAEGWKDFKNIVEMGESCEITIGKNGKTTFCGNTGLDFNGTDEVKAFIATGFDKDESIIWMTRIMDVPAGVPVMIKGEANTTYNIPVTDGGTSYYKNMFVGNTSGETISISETSEDGKYVNYYMSGGQFKSVNTSANIGNNKCYLQLPANLGAESTGEPLQVKIAASGKSSFAAPYDLDFTSLNDDVKAFTATGYDKSSKTIWLTRVKKVQKGEGLLLKGTGGETYTIPSSGVQAAYVNMIVGNISGENLEIGETSKNGTLTNYYLKGGTYVSVSGTANIGTNKSYLQLPTYMLAGSRSEDAVNVSDVQTTYNVVELETESMPIIFASIGNDDNGTTGIQSMFNDQSSMFNDQWYTLSGQRISKPTKSGLYIHNGRKVVIK